MGNKYIYYKLSSSEISTAISLKPCYKIKIYHPRLGKLNNHTHFKIIYLFWYFFTIGRYIIYYVYDENDRIIHFSHVMPNFFKYAFIQQQNSIHIGPCWTHENYRGKGIYPAVLNKICTDNSRKNVFIDTSPLP